jgi:hypothetical protein
MIDVLFISPRQFQAKPQVGTPRTLTWLELIEFLSEPAWGDSKDAVGGWTPGRYHENVRRKANLTHASALVIDIDRDGDVDKVAGEFGLHDCIIHETFSSTPATPRCRVVLRFAEPVGVETYEHVHRVIRRRLREDLHIGVDDGAKDVCRLSYSPVRRAGSGYRFRTTVGKPLDAVAIVKANPPLVRMLPALPVYKSQGDKTKYVDAALRRAAASLGGAHVGSRHETLCKEAYSLARLGLTLGEITRALVPAAIASMGEERRREIERTIVDGFRARKDAS